MPKKASLLWLDLEMTGLDADKDRILEVAAIATDWNFNEIATFDSAVKVSDEIIAAQMVGDFWSKFSKVRKKLVAQNENAESTSEEVQEKLLQFLIDNFDMDKPIYLAGNSIHKDREFIATEWPILDDKLHYRMLDVSAWKIVFANKFGLEIKKPDHHRASDDVRGSIEELKNYLEKISI